MNKPNDKGKGHGKRRRKAKVQPGIILSWEAFNEEAMREYLEAITEGVADDLDELEQALRSLN